jgi:hypothetical protein
MLKFRDGKLVSFRAFCDPDEDARSCRLLKGRG